MPATREEITALDALRAMEGRPPLAPHEIEALSYDPPPARVDVSGMSEEEALAWLGAQQQQTADQAPAAPAPHAASDFAGLLVAGAPLTGKERAELAQIDAEYRAGGRGPLTADKAASLVAIWRARAAA